MVNRFNLTYDDWGSIGKGALIAAAGAVLTYASEHVTAQNFGIYAPMIAALLAVVVNYFRKVLNIPAPVTMTEEKEEEFVDEEFDEEIEIDDSFPDEKEESDDTPLDSKSTK